MSKASKLKKGKHQKGLKELWNNSMNLEESNPGSPKTPVEERQDIKKRTPPSTEKPKPKRATKTLTPDPQSKELAEMEEPVNPPKTDTQVPKEPDKVHLSPELLELYNMLHRDLDNKIDPLQRSVNDIQTKLSSQENRIEEVMTKLSTQENKIEGVMNIKHEYSKLHTCCTAMEKENKLLKDRLTAIENQLLENNITLQGINEDAWELNSVLREKTYHALANTIEASTRQKQLEEAKKMPIKKIQRMGKYNSNRGRPISVSFTYKEDADYVYENKSKLKKGIYIDREYNPETESNRRILRPILRKARSLDLYKKKCKMEGDQLIIKSKTYTVDNLSELPDEINGFNSTSKTDGETLGFFGELNPLSNFHRCNFNINNTTYHSTEQFIQHEKAIFFKDINIANKIMESKTPIECMLLSKEIENVDMDRWKEVAKARCQPGIAAKFEQNHNLGNMLKNTGDLLLVESSFNSTWGTGVPLHREDCLNKNQWTSIGILGELLMEVRKKLLEPMDTNGSN